MRLTHYEDGLLCGDRFCINLIRRLGDTFPGLGEGQSQTASERKTEGRMKPFFWGCRRRSAQIKPSPAGKVAGEA